jgi:hypothetical protein
VGQQMGYVKCIFQRLNQVSQQTVLENQLLRTRKLGERKGSCQKVSTARETIVYRLDTKQEIRFSVNGVASLISTCLQEKTLPPGPSRTTNKDPGVRRFDNFKIEEKIDTCQLSIFR